MNSPRLCTFLRRMLLINICKSSRSTLKSNQIRQPYKQILLGAYCRPRTLTSPNAINKKIGREALLKTWFCMVRVAAVGCKIEWLGLTAPAKWFRMLGSRYLEVQWRARRCLLCNSPIPRFKPVCQDTRCRWRVSSGMRKRRVTRSKSIGNVWPFPAYEWLVLLLSRL